MFGKIKFNSNPCDHGWSELIIHLTKKCDNKCPFCITNNDDDIGFVEPNVKAICSTIDQYKYRNPYVIINGGEPMLYLNELEQIVDYVHNNTSCKVYVFSSIPKKCIDEFDTFQRIVSKLDGFIISAQHFDHRIANKIRGVESKHNRDFVYKSLENKKDIVISLNIVKPYYTCKQDVLDNLEYFYNLGYRQFKLVEIKDNLKYYINVTEFLGVKVKSEYAWKCSPEIPLNTLLPNKEGSVKLNLTCFLRNPEKKANFWDLVKSILRPLFSKHGHTFGVIYENGDIHPYWLKKQ